jgi:uncharacterized OsmC-like protein
MKVKIKPMVAYQLSAEAESHSRTLLRARDLIDVSDEPKERGGTNEGFAPTEFILGGLAACTNVISHKIAHQAGFEISAMDIKLAAKFNRLGVNLIEEVDLIFPEIHLIVRVVTNGSDEQVELLKKDLPRFCAVSKLIHQSGTRIEYEWIIEQTE